MLRLHASLFGHESDDEPQIQPALTEGGADDYGPGVGLSGSGTSRSGAACSGDPSSGSSGVAGSGTPAPASGGPAPTSQIDQADTDSDDGEVWFAAQRKRKVQAPLPAIKESLASRYSKEVDRLTAKLLSHAAKNVAAVTMDNPPPGPTTPAKAPKPCDEVDSELKLPKEKQKVAAARARKSKKTSEAVPAKPLAAAPDEPSAAPTKNPSEEQPPAESPPLGPPWKRAVRGTANTFAGRRPPKNPEKLAIFMA